MQGAGMMLLVRELRLPITATEQDAVATALRVAGLKAGAVAEGRVHKLSVDARHGTPSFVYTVALFLKEGAAAQSKKLNNRAVQLIEAQPFLLPRGTQGLAGRVVVCGLGPAGLFAALELAEAGFAPLVLERGPDMETRRAAVQAFEAGGVLDENANIQFGEGGAGTFSDGKLTTRIKDPLCARVTQRLLEAGAPEEIRYKAKPHIGTDLLRDVFQSLRQKIVALGGEVLFDTKLSGVSIQQSRVTAVQTTAGEFACGALVLCVGHSARDTFSMLAQSGVPLQGKDFSVGCRIEHLQSEIDKGLYHEAAGHPALGPGEYALSHRGGARGVYTFCMCPGGSVVAATSEAGGVVTNGMSTHARSGLNANSAVVASVSALQDFGGDPFKAIEFQRRLEQAAFAAGGSSYAAPAETVGSFMQGGGKLALGRVQPTYPRGVQAANLGSLLPGDIADCLRAGLRSFGRKLPGFDAADAVLTGLETRTSSPVRIPRGEGYECEGVAGLYPCGEGAGYAGGIMSAATDGLRVAGAIVGRFAPGE